MARYVASRQRDERLLPVADEEALYQGEVFYFTCIGGREELLPAYEALPPGQGPLGAAPGGNLPARGVLAGGDVRRRHQGPGRRLAERAPGLPAHDSLWDGLNDIPLLEEADVRCAVANAVPQLRQAAGQVIPANTEDGVARFLLADTAPTLALGERAGDFRLRLYRPQDLEGLIQLFYETVHEVNLGDYSPAEVDAWVPSPESVDRAAWGESLAAHYTVVAERKASCWALGTWTAPAISTGSTSTGTSRAGEWPHPLPTPWRALPTALGPSG